MFDRFTDQAKNVMNAALAEAQKLRNHYIGTEHLLLGVASSGGTALDALAHFGVEPQAIRREVEALCHRESDTEKWPQLPFTPRAKRVLELSMEEAAKLGHNYLDAEHLLLGLRAEGEGIAADVLTRLGVELDPLREEVRRQHGLRPEDQR
jgi:ATP-dependent Clp protease ATP-binding subunit ClpC